MRFRPIWFLKLIRFFFKVCKVKVLLTLFDPNSLRKKVNYSFKPRVICVKVKSGSNLFVDVNDHIGWRIFMLGFWDNVVLQISKILELQRGDLILDIGANIGAVSIPVGKMLDVGIIAIEASKSNSELFIKNAKLNSVKSKMHQVAVVSPYTYLLHKFITIYENNGNRGANSLSKDWNPSIINKTENLTRTATLDSVLSKDEISRIKIIKIDIEGSEYEALQGFNSLKRILAPLIFEYRIDIGSIRTVNNSKKFAVMLSRNYLLYAVNISYDTVTFNTFNFENSYENAIAIQPKFVSKLKSNSSVIFNT